MRRLVVAMIVVTTLGAAPVASARVPNACKLLTATQVKAALQAKLQWAQRQGTGKYQTCTWHGEPYNPSSFGQPTLTLTVSETTRASFKRFALRYGEPVKGVGELAFLQGGTVRSLTVFDKGYSLMFSIPQDDGGLARTKAAAVAALSHL